MNSYRIKLSILFILCLAFLLYSIQLYTLPVHDSQNQNPQVQQGKKIWQEKNCISCHQFYGLGGHLGPDLTNVSGKRPESYIRAFLTSGTDVMPNFHLSEQEKDALISFLNYTNTTGKSSPSHFKINLDGTIQPTK